MARVFMGSGEHSTAQCQRLMDLLEEALSLIGGSQQPCHCDYANCGCGEFVAEAEVKVNDIAMEIVKSLLEDPTTLTDRGEESTVPKLEDMYKSVEEASQRGRMFLALTCALEEPAMAFSYIQDIIKGTIGPEHTLPRRPRVNLHKEAQKLEEKSVRLFGTSSTHDAHNAADMARSLRMVANYLDGNNAG
jgi:hypothetical protein